MSLREAEMRGGDADGEPQLLSPSRALVLHAALTLPYPGVRKNLSAWECQPTQEYEKCGGAEDAADCMETVPALQEAPRFV